MQRWVKMARYLRSFGWEPVIYTAENGEMPVVDHTLEATLPKDLTVIRRPIWEPYSLYRKVLGLKKEEKINAAFLQEKKKKGFMQDAAVWIRGNFFIPDARKFWIKPSVAFLAEYLKKNPVDAIVTTGPPHSMHLIGMGVAQQLPIPWVADFRDPWTKIDYYAELKLTKRADAKHRALEKQVLLHATKVVTVSRHWAEDFNAVNNGNTEVITNAFDENDFRGEAGPLYAGFLLHHVGMVNKARNPELFWKVLHALCDEDKQFAADLRVQLTGKTDHSVLECVSKYRLEKNLIRIDHVSHKEAISSMRRSPVLLLLLNDTHDILGRIPAKVFEYLAAARPVLAVGDTNGDAAQIIRDAGAGEVAELQNEDSIRAAIMKLYAAFRSGNLYVNPKGIEKYTGLSIAEKYAALLDAL